MKPPAPARRHDDDQASLFAEFIRTRDPALREQLIAEHVNLVRYLAAKFASRGEPLDDLVQVGMIGLINAIDRYEPDRGVRFSTYATPTIVGEIKRYFRDRAWNLKVPRWLQELNFQVMKANDALTQTLGRSPSILEIAEQVGCTEEEALQAIELGSAYETVSLDSHLDPDGEPGLTLSDSLGAEDADLDQIDAYDDLNQALELLDPREKMILYLRFFHDLSQTEVAKRLNISQMHVSRLQNRALKRLRQALTDEQWERFRQAA
ncbi:MAG: SigB/SigF/SigG family RNA polymerase sigma factor [Armatimonadota bacterium]